VDTDAGLNPELIFSFCRPSFFALQNFYCTLFSFADLFQGFVEEYIVGHIGFHFECCM